MREGGKCRHKVIAEGAAQPGVEWGVGVGKGVMARRLINDPLCVPAVQGASTLGMFSDSLRGTRMPNQYKWVYLPGITYFITYFGICFQRN